MFMISKAEKSKLLSEKITPEVIINVVWNGRNEQGNPVASGIYLYKMKSGSFSKSRKMILLK